MSAILENTVSIAENCGDLYNIFKTIIITIINYLI